MNHVSHLVSHSALMSGLVCDGCDGHWFVMGVKMRAAAVVLYGKESLALPASGYHHPYQALRGPWGRFRGGHRTTITHPRPS